MSNALSVTAQNFDAEVLRSNIPVLVDFWAEWCGPCKMIAPHVDAIAEEFAGTLKVCKVNIDEEGSIAGRYGIMSIPTLLIIKGGQVATQIVGAMPKQQLIEKIRPYIG
jgi:thioredoxin 1